MSVPNLLKNRRFFPYYARIAGIGQQKNNTDKDKTFLKSTLFSEMNTEVRVCKRNMQY